MFWDQVEFIGCKRRVKLMVFYILSVRCLFNERVVSLPNRTTHDFCFQNWLWEIFDFEIVETLIIFENGLLQRNLLMWLIVLGKRKREKCRVIVVVKNVVHIWIWTVVIIVNPYFISTTGVESQNAVHMMRLEIFWSYHWEWMHISPNFDNLIQEILLFRMTNNCPFQCIQITEGYRRVVGFCSETVTPLLDLWISENIKPW